MKNILFLSLIVLALVACSENDAVALGQQMLSEQEAKEGKNSEHFQVQEEAARVHKDK
ncbi:MAG: hypothetical protein OEZ68_04415 [Gammaproteobacteria bacterium]|nr:hypothetical protein [Gammaproteobacteria bacterium]MDH5800032.1 hypothetical protein [Gammaproteobacteria bacterium]